MGNSVVYEGALGVSFRKSPMTLRPTINTLVLGRNTDRQKLHEDVYDVDCNTLRDTTKQRQRKWTKIRTLSLEIEDGDCLTTGTRGRVFVNEETGHIWQNFFSKRTLSLEIEVGDRLTTGTRGRVFANEEPGHTWEIFYSKRWTETKDRNSWLPKTEGEPRTCVGLIPWVLSH